MAGPQLCTVYIPGANGERYATNVSATSSHDAARQAIEFFRDRFWRGPKPTAATVLEIVPMSGPRVRVRVESITATA